MNAQDHTTIASLLLAAVLGLSGCSNQREAAQKRVTPEYDKNGKLRLLKYDSKGNGIVDTWSYMDGGRVVRIEIDKNDDGVIDRWEYYEADQALKRVEISRNLNGKIDRLEHYARGAIVSAEEDSDADGKMDKWETYDGPRLASVAFDTSHRGVPDRRLTYGPGGTATMEIDAKGDGHLMQQVAAAFPAPADSSAK